MGGTDLGRLVRMWFTSLSSPVLSLSDLHSIARKADIRPRNKVSNTLLTCILCLFYMILPHLNKNYRIGHGMSIFIHNRNFLTQISCSKVIYLQDVTDRQLERVGQAVETLPSEVQGTLHCLLITAKAVRAIHIIFFKENIRSCDKIILLDVL